MEYADIFIYGDIGEKVKLIDVVTQVRNNPNADGFNVHINSPGGYVDTGFQIFDYLKSLKKPVTTIGESLVASIATVIHSAGDKRTVMPNTDYMIHLPMGGIDGTADEIEKYGEEVKAVENRILKFYMDTTGNTKEAILPLLQEETWLNEDQLLTLGFITEKTQKIAAKAYLKSPKNKNMSTEKKEGDLISALTKALKGLVKSEVNAKKIVFTGDQKEVLFPELDEEASIEVGATATIEGSPAEGEVILADGRTLVFEAGAVTEIREEMEEEDEEMAVRIQELEKQLSDQAEAINKKEEEIQNLKKENEKQAKAIQAVEKIRSEFSAKKKDKPDNTKTSRASAALAKLKLQQNN